MTEPIQLKNLGQGLKGSELRTGDVVKETDVASRKLTALPRQREFLNGKPKFLRAKLSLAN